MKEQPATIDWRDDDTPVSRQFGDPYFSLDGGLDETLHVFLAGNNLPARFRPGFRILETGFGTGLNLLAAWWAFDRAGTRGRFVFTSTEAYPMTLADMARAHAAFPTLHDRAEELRAALSNGPGPWKVGPVDLDILQGDARETLPQWQGTADAVFLDGFSPARNPEMWEPVLLHTIAGRMARGATLATYTAAGHVRRSLAAAGLEVTRERGYGRKRHMTRAVKP